MRLDSERLKCVEAQRLARRLQQGSDLADVFARYERDVDAARAEAQAAGDQNRQLLQQLQALALEGERTCRKCGGPAGVPQCGPVHGVGWCAETRLDCE